MRLMLALALLVCGGCGDAETVPGTGAETESPARNRPVVVVKETPVDGISMATYNVNWGNARLEEVIETIREADADVVCLQEVNNESLAAIRRELADRYKTIRFHGSTDIYAAGGFALLSRLEITAEKFLPPEHGLFGTCIFEVKLGDQPVQFANVHLQPVMFARGEGVRGTLANLGALGKAEETHRKEIGRGFENLRQDVPTLIVGDFNSLSTFKAPTFLREQGFTDSCASIHENPESQITWCWPLEHGEVKLRIDYIFHSGDLTTTTCRTIQSDGSDHYLLVSRLELE
jgi:endonuclease/exonuclease/phosphatase family metal-dependent hydrolase